MNTAIIPVVTAIAPNVRARPGQAWFEQQRQWLLPPAYFMVTFTLPEPLRRLARSHQKVMYNLLFRTAAAALQALAQAPRFVGGQSGLVGVLHTWGRDLSDHPHVHFLGPGGGLSPDGQQWLTSKARFLVHVKPLGKLFRAKFRAALQQTELFNQVPSRVWREAWVVHSQAVGDGQAALKYLAPYIFRVAISNNRIIKVAEEQGTFRYTPSGRKKSQRCTLPAEEFIRRFLQHVLPKGFVKVRYYGLFAPGQRPRLKQARALLEAQRPQRLPRSQSRPGPRVSLNRCPRLTGFVRNVGDRCAGNGSRRVGRKRPKLDGGALTIEIEERRLSGDTAAGVCVVDRPVSGGHGPDGVARFGGFGGVHPRWGDRVGSASGARGHVWPPA